MILQDHVENKSKLMLQMVLCAHKVAPNGRVKCVIIALI